MEASSLFLTGGFVSVLGKGAFRCDLQFKADFIPALMPLFSGLTPGFRGRPGGRPHDSPRIQVGAVQMYDPFWVGSTGDPTCFC